MTLYLQYDSDVLKDGLGAQALRLVTLRGIATYFKCQYVNSNLETEFLDYGLVGEDYDSRVLNEVNRRVNEFFTFPQNIAHSFESYHRVVNVKDLGSKELIANILRDKFSYRQTLLKVAFPFYVSERFPQVLESLPSEIRERNGQEFSKYEPAELSIHMRMGWGTLITKNSAPRHLPFHYYVDAVMKMLKKGWIGYDSRIVIHTDVPPVDMVWEIKNEATRKELQRVGALSSEDFLTLKGHNIDEVFQNLNFRNIKVNYGADWIQTLIEMSVAKKLIIARSAFSYLAGILNPNLVVWPNNHGHKRLPAWISSEDLEIDAREYDLVIG